MSNRTHRRRFQVKATVMEKNIIGLVLFSAALYFLGRYIGQAGSSPAPAPGQVDAAGSGTVGLRVPTPGN